MSRRGFTLVELAIVLAIFAFLTPLAYMAGRALLENFERAAFDLQVAESARTVSEELQLDLRTMKLQSGDGVLLKGAGDCAEASWEVKGAALIRTPKANCGEPRALAKSVSAFRSTAAGMELVFALPQRGGVVHEVMVLVGGAR